MFTFELSWIPRWKIPQKIIIGYFSQPPFEPSIFKLTSAPFPIPYRYLGHASPPCCYCHKFLGHIHLPWQLYIVLRSSSDHHHFLCPHGHHTSAVCSFLKTFTSVTISNNRLRFASLSPIFPFVSPRVRMGKKKLSCLVGQQAILPVAAHIWANILWWIFP